MSFRTHMLRRVAPIALAGAVALSGVSSSFAAGETYKQDKVEKMIGIMDTIVAEYKYDVTADDLYEGAYKGIFEALDKHSVYFTKNEFAEFTTDAIDGEFVGIGVTLNKVGDSFQTMDVFEGSPAEKAGIVKGDRITSVDGESAAGMDTNVFLSRVKGEEGTSVTLTVVSKSTGKTRTVIVKRQTIKIPMVKSKMLSGNVGYISISTFSSGVAKSFSDSLSSLNGKGARALVIDLRDNPGGLISEVLAIANMFVEKDKVLLYEDMKGDEGDETIKSVASPVFTGKKIAVLVNKNSASASEILSGILQDYGLAKIVGETTYGKGTVQGVAELPDKSGYKLTIAEYFTPSKKKIDGVGIKPNVAVKNPDGTERVTRGDLVALSAAKSPEDITLWKRSLSVYALQQRLMVLGYDVKATGSADTKTMNALNESLGRSVSTKGVSLTKDVVGKLQKLVEGAYSGDVRDVQLEAALKTVK